MCAVRWSCGLTYSVDTSAILRFAVRSYPIANFPSLWGRIETLIADGRFRATELVLDELKKKEDDTYRWFKVRDRMFVPLDAEIQRVARNILRSHPRLVDQRKGRSGADPFVIALGEMNGWTVVTDEDVGNAAKPHIPFVCQARGVEVLSVLEFIRREDWVI